MRWLVTTTITIALLILALALFTHWLKRISLFFPDRHPRGFWNFADLPIEPSEHQFLTPDGVLLHGLLFEPVEASDSPLIIWFHGNAGNVTNRAAIASRFAEMGSPIFVFDYRGFGKSEGRISERGAAVDSIAAYDYITRRVGRQSGSVALYGESIGAAFAAWVARERPALCVVVESSFPSLSRVAWTVYPYTPFPLFVGGSLRVADWLNEAGLPVLVLHGTNDPIIPFRLGVELYEQLEVPKTLLPVEGASHSDISAVLGDGYVRRVRDFVEAARRESVSKRRVE
ncbi:MAG TPA: alpha/beta hydrolase [Thermoanaerobaculia bacterium]|nr:alpha/beta hydrolase [Thermoanaerobaculia bacterium]